MPSRTRCRPQSASSETTAVPVVVHKFPAVAKTTEVHSDALRRCRRPAAHDSRRSHQGSPLPRPRCFCLPRSQRQSHGAASHARGKDGVDRSALEAGVSLQSSVVSSTEKSLTAKAAKAGQNSPRVSLVLALTLRSSLLKALGMVRASLGMASSPYELPIKIPVANTSAPPKPTCNAADGIGVSM